MPESRFLDLSISLNAIDAANGKDAGAPGDDDDMTIDTELLVEPIEDNPSWFKVAEPLTFFGTAPILNMGDIIQVEESEFDGLLMTKVISRGRSWSHAAGVLTGGMNQLREEPLNPLLDQFIEAGGMWEYCSMRVVLQYPLDSDQSEPPAHVLELADEISWVLRVSSLNQHPTPRPGKRKDQPRRPGETPYRIPLKRRG